MPQKSQLAQTLSEFKQNEADLIASSDDWEKIAQKLELVEQLSEDDINYILNQIKDRQLNIAPDYYSWLRIGFGLADKLGDSGREAFNLISSYYSGKQKTDPNKQFDKCLKSGKSGITIKSFFYYAKLAGCNLTSDRTKKIITIGKIRRKQEQTSGSGAIVNGREDAKQYLIDFEAISGSDVDDILNQVWTIPSKDLESEEGLLYDIELLKIPARGFLF